MVPKEHVFNYEADASELLENLEEMSIMNKKLYILELKPYVSKGLRSSNISYNNTDTCLCNSFLISMIYVVTSHLIEVQRSIDRVNTMRGGEESVN